MGVDLQLARAGVLQAVGAGPKASSARPGHIPFTPRGKKVLEMSLREALQLGHNYIGTEHILLGLIREGEGVAANVLRQLGADLETVRSTVIGLLAGSVPATADEPPPRRPTERRERAITPGQVRRAQALLSVAEAKSEDYPLCPNCSASLAENASVRTRELTPEDEPSHVIKIAYCARCGITLGIKIV
jgi:ATP-dependent Clp protease ATP-binding subunit ClpA